MCLYLTVLVEIGLWRWLFILYVMWGNDCLCFRTTIRSNTPLSLSSFEFRPLSCFENIILPPFVYVVIMADTMLLSLFTPKGLMHTLPSLQLNTIQQSCLFRCLSGLTLRGPSQSIRWAHTTFTAASVPSLPPDGRPLWTVALMLSRCQIRPTFFFLLVFTLFCPSYFFNIH